MNCHRSFVNGARRRAWSRTRRWKRDAGAIARRHFTEPRVWTVYAAMVALFTLIDPFGMGARLPPASSPLYWATAMLIGWVVSLSAVAALSPLLPRRWPEPARVIAASIAAGPLVALGVRQLNVLVIGKAFATFSFARAALVFMGIGAAMGLLGVLAASPRGAAAAPGPAPQPSPPAPPAAPRAPAILQRLRPDRRGALIRMSMHDHYVEVVTDRGAELVLLRLSDAMDEAAPVEGMQVHRSHWVARHAVKEVKREAGRLRLSLSDGSEAPVSRGRAAALAEAGWI